MNLNEKEIALIIEGLSYIPKERVYQDIQNDFIKTALKEKEAPLSYVLEKYKEDQLLQDEVITLQAKFVQLKSFLLDKKIKKDVDDILNKKN